MKNDCLFCALLKDEIPSYKIYEDEDFVAILDRFPKCEGHTLIIPKKHAQTLLDLPAETAEKIFPLAQKLAAALLETLGFTGLNLLQNNGADAGQQVSHFHLHLIPRYKDDSMVIQWPVLDPSPEEFEALQKKLL